jgi:hypothetical protein
MTFSDFDAFISARFSDAKRTEAYGYIFFFHPSDEMLPFASLIDADTEYDKYSDLNRPGVYRLNIGITPKTYAELIPDGSTETAEGDFRVLDTFLPHPEYAKQRYVCILSPTGERLERAKQLLDEAYDLAAARGAAKAPKS